MAMTPEQIEAERIRKQKLAEAKAKAKADKSKYAKKQLETNKLAGGLSGKPLEDKNRSQLSPEATNAITGHAKKMITNPLEDAKKIGSKLVSGLNSSQEVDGALTSGQVSDITNFAGNPLKSSKLGPLTDMYSKENTVEDDKSNSPVSPTPSTEQSSEVSIDNQDDLTDEVQIDNQDELTDGQDDLTDEQIEKNNRMISDSYVNEKIDKGASGLDQSMLFDLMDDKSKKTKFARSLSGQEPKTSNLYVIGDKRVTYDEMQKHKKEKEAKGIDTTGEKVNSFKTSDRQLKSNIEASNRRKEENTRREQGLQESRDLKTAKREQAEKDSVYKGYKSQYMREQSSKTGYTFNKTKGQALASRIKRDINRRLRIAYPDLNQNQIREATKQEFAKVINEEKKAKQSAIREYESKKEKARNISDKIQQQNFKNKKAVAELDIKKQRLEASKVNATRKQKVDYVNRERKIQKENSKSIDYNKNKINTLKEKMNKEEEKTGRIDSKNYKLYEEQIESFTQKNKDLNKQNFASSYYAKSSVDKNGAKKLAVESILAHKGYEGFKVIQNYSSFRKVVTKMFDDLKANGINMSKVDIAKLVRNTQDKEGQKVIDDGRKDRKSKMAKNTKKQ